MLKKLPKFNYKTDEEVRLLFTYCPKEEFRAYMEEVKEYEDRLLRYQRQIYESIGALESYDIKVDTNSLEYASAYIEDLIKKVGRHKDIMAKFLKERQDNCEHNWVNIGHDSHYDLYECSKCGLTDKA